MPTTTLPAYEQVKAFVKAQINSGTWRPGDAVPSEAALQQQFGVSRMTVNRAVKELAVEGVVSRVQGSGTVVAQLHRISSTLAIRDIHEEILERGHTHTTRVLTLETVRADVALARVFKLRTGARMFHSVMVHEENGVPIQLEDRHVNPVAAPDYLAVDFSTITPTHYLLEQAPLTEASYSIEATLASAQEAGQLGIPPGEPCLVMTRSTISGPHVASLARLVYPGRRYSFNGTFQL
ncbi:histidine utilization repressor [Rhodoferax sp.]|uniref:histidine utilization repressor n=1 Tax=Rhodoferax sp. TaxID=50421 RepID=UPI002638E072|nr:histidine utilization repressor [Rhodoferax sp.]MDD2925969.1 histidine utilization repressor [Rhodoferax sp.]